MARTAAPQTPAGVAGLASDELSAEDQAQLDQMRADDAAEPLEETPAEPAAEPEEGAEGTDPAAAPADGRPRMVPHAALHEERLKRQAAEATIAEERKARTTLEERTNLLLQRMQQPQAQPTQQQVAEIPSVETDPVGHIVGRMNQQGALLQQVVEALVQAGQQNQAAQAGATIQQRALAFEAEFRTATPDYDAAVEHLTAMRNKQLIAAGWTDAAERRTMISQEALGVAQRAIQANRNPAEVIYEIAKSSGWTTPDPAAAANGTATPPAATPTAAARIANVANGQRQAGTSLSNARGAAPAPIDAQKLVNMSTEEFTDFMSKATQAQLRAAMGE